MNNNAMVAHCGVLLVPSIKNRCCQKITRLQHWVKSPHLPSASIVSVLGIGAVTCLRLAQMLPLLQPSNSLQI